jgi:hypothetical protein
LFVIFFATFVYVALGELIWPIICLFVCFFFFFTGSLLSLLVAEPVVDSDPAIDVVYTWVNGSDPAQLHALHIARQRIFGINESDSKLAEEVADASRYIDNEELRYSMRRLDNQTSFFDLEQERELNKAKQSCKVCSLGAQSVSRDERPGIWKCLYFEKRKG